VPVVVTTVDTPERSRASFDVIDALTDEDGLVLSERVPAFRASGPGISLGALPLLG
jgi:PII-like signaling protein